MAIQMASDNVYEPISYGLARLSKKFVTYFTNASCISFNDGKIVIARPVAKICRSLPYGIKCLVNIYTSLILFFTFACVKKEKRPMQTVESS